MVGHLHRQPIRIDGNRATPASVSRAAHIANAPSLYLFLSSYINHRALARARERERERERRPYTSCHLNAMNFNNLFQTFNYSLDNYVSLFGSFDAHDGRFTVLKCGINGGDGSGFFRINSTPSTFATPLIKFVCTL